MARILILDNGRASSAFLKMTLTRHRHQVVRTGTLKDTINHRFDSTSDMVLINHAFGNGSGWEAFNYLKQIAPHVPIMVYVLAQLNMSAAAWIIKAIDMVIHELENEPGAGSIPHANPNKENCHV